MNFATLYTPDGVAEVTGPTGKTEQVRNVPMSATDWTEAATRGGWKMVHCDGPWSMFKSGRVGQTLVLYAVKEAE